jgi:dethiobiotin synthetase
VRAPLLIVTGTGTEIGKTHVSVALLTAWARSWAARSPTAELKGLAGLKPVETGIPDSDAAPSDGQMLEQASTFHVKRFPPPYLLRRAVSPHLAAAGEGRTIELGPILRYVEELRGLTDGVLVELAGGLFSPLADGLSNADVAAALEPTKVVLVAPDRLGVLHDVAAATRAATAHGLVLTGIVLVHPVQADASTGSNAMEMRVVTDVPVLAIVPREAVSVTASRPELSEIARALG